MRRELNQMSVPTDFDETPFPPRCLGLHDRTSAAICAYSPVITHRATSGGKLELDLGTAGTQTDIDLRPDYTLNWLPAPGQSAVIKVRLRYLYKGEEYGNWSEWHTWDPHRGLDARRHIDRNAKTVHSQTQKDFRHRKHHETPAHFLPPLPWVSHAQLSIPAAVAVDLAGKPQRQRRNLHLHNGAKPLQFGSLKSRLVVCDFSKQQYQRQYIHWDSSSSGRFASEFFHF